jgi:hypothetical protein
MLEEFKVGEGWEANTRFKRSGYMGYDMVLEEGV